MLCHQAPRGFWHPYVAEFKLGGRKHPREHERILNSALKALPRGEEARLALDDLLMTYHGLMRAALRCRKTYRPPCQPYFGTPQPSTPKFPHVFEPIFEARRWLDEQLEGGRVGVNALEVDPVCALSSRIEVYGVLGKDQYNFKARQWLDRLMDRTLDRNEALTNAARNHQGYLDGAISKWDVDLAHF